ncbi:MAG: LppM family (lipo)protein, partial [Acidimicrobiia bacterium]
MRGMLRTGGRVLALAALALLLSGCLKLDEHLTLKPDNTVDGTVTFGVSKQLIQMTGQSASDVLDQMTQSGAPVPSGVPNVQTSDYSDDTFVGKTYTFSGASLDQINGQGADQLTIKRDQDTFVVDGTLDLSSGGAAGIDLNDPTTKTLMQNFQVSIAITFP